MCLNYQNDHCLAFVLILNVFSFAVPGEVQDLQATVTTNRIYINWTEPEDTACVAYYNIQLNNETIDTTKETTYTIYDLEYCTSYIVGVAAESDKDAGEYSVITAEIETTTGKLKYI